jgi:hypothetical protein
MARFNWFWRGNTMIFGFNKFVLELKEDFRFRMLLLVLLWNTQKKVCQKKPTQNISPIKNMVFQTDKAFKEVASRWVWFRINQEPLLVTNVIRLAYLVERSDICYTIRFWRRNDLSWFLKIFALGYLIKLVKDSIDAKYN